MNNNYPNRKEYIEEQRELGRRPVLVMPIQVPREIFTAMDLLAVELWGPPGKTYSESSTHLQAFNCAIIQNALGFLLRGEASMTEAVVVPHTCDSFQGLATLLPDMLAWKQPVLTFHHPANQKESLTRRFLRAEINNLIQRLEKLFGPLDPDRLRQAIRWHREADQLQIQLFQRRRELNIYDRDFFTLLRSGEYLWIQDYLDRLRDTHNAPPVENAFFPHIPLMLTGIVSEPMEIFDVLNEAHAYVADDDLAVMGRRRIEQELPSLNDPIEALVELQLNLPPCPSRGSSQRERIDRLIERLRRSDAKGLLHYNVKFCEPELFDAPAIAERCRAEAIPYLYLETELDRTLSAQTRTRMEAFVEMLD